MTKLDDFKQFIATIPSIKEDVLNSRYTWQQLYEIYILYGKEDKFWLPYKNKSNTIDLLTLYEIVKNLDMQQVSNSLTSIEKVLTMLGTFLPDNKETTSSKTTKWYDE
ncbi:YlbD family protein [Tannockella kyphosi]|uniref:YlbD family protein n=1 Tax=Tannockella kyphosi TaxID=2899121 RepID=UPI002011F19E|nr:YlbD family protein [Tannockella kyphosi]